MAWIDAAFATAKVSRAAGVLVMMQAEPTWSAVVEDGIGNRLHPGTNVGQAVFDCGD